MMMFRRLYASLWLAILLLALVSAGCQKSKEGDASNSTPSANGKSDTEANAKTGEDEKKGPDLASVPASVKHDGFSYYGLDNAKPIEYEVVSTSLTQPDQGSATTNLSAVEGEVARFVTSRTGTALSSMGDEEVEARKDGIYNTKIGGNPVEPAQLVLPAELPVGKTWQTEGKVTAQTPQGMKTFQQKFNYKVSGVEKVKTKAGEFDALKVLADGTISVDGKSSRSEVAAWYVKGLGTVKMAITTAGEQKGTMTIEATKVP